MLWRFWPACSGMAKSPIMARSSTWLQRDQHRCLSILWCGAVCESDGWQQRERTRRPPEAEPCQIFPKAGSPMRKRSAWLILCAAVLALAAIVYFNRELLLRAAIAYRIYRAHVFTPPPTTSGESRFHRLRSDAQFYW